MGRDQCRPHRLGGKTGDPHFVRTWPKKKLEVQSSGPENGGGGHPGRRGRPRFQQSPAIGTQGHASLMLLDHLSPQDLHYNMLKTIEEQVKSGADLTWQLLSKARPADLNALSKDLHPVWPHQKGDQHPQPFSTGPLAGGTRPRADRTGPPKPLCQRLAGRRGLPFLETTNVILDEDYENRLPSSRETMRKFRDRHGFGNG